MIVSPTDVISPAPTATSAAGAGETPAAGRLERAAYQVVATHSLQPPASAVPALVANLDALAQILHKAHQQVTATAAEALGLSYAAEWLIDNYYVVEQAVFEVKQDMPSGFYAKLPKLGATSALPGLPRVYALARAYLAVDDFHLDAERLARFVTAYQATSPLALSEVWALPVMLRLALLEGLALGAAHVTQTPDQAGVLAALEQRFAAIPVLSLSLAGSELSDADLVASSIPSLRQIDVTDWLLFSERVSVIHRQLEDDPAGVYPYMDFDTRNRYRGRIEQLALGSRLSELDVARAAIDLAAQAQESVLPVAPAAAQAATAAGQGSHYPGIQLDLPPECHVGYYLVDAGRPQLEARIGYQPAPRDRLLHWVYDHPTVVYLAPILTIVVLVLAAGLAYAGTVGAGWAWLLGIAVLLAAPALTIAVNLVDLLVTHLLPPRVLPKLDFAEGVPEACATLVVIPGLISHPEDVDDLFDQLEQHYLRNPDPALRFAMLTDFADAPAATMPEDAGLIAYAQEQLAAINARYSHQPFFFLHRRRLWNSAQGTWMGWERKRGKLHELNRLLRGATDTSFAWVAGDRPALAAMRFVITLDADTVLARDGAQRLIGALAHPLNRARFDASGSRVTAGYTVLQPRAEIKPTSANRSLYTRVFAGDTGLDLYTLAVSDTYQDLFGAGIFVGKGIYAVDAFERSLHGRVPENTLLSHDLFEGIHGRAGLVTDIVVYEDYPPNYLVEVRRLHRWMRGDWQLLPWLLPQTPRVAEQGVTRARNDLPLIDRWKIFDNLRRSLLPLTLLAIFLLGWTLLPGAAWAWTLFGLLTPLMALAAGALAAAARLLRHGGWRKQGDWRHGILFPLRDSAVRWLLYLAFLPVEATIAIDAAMRTLWRMTISHRNLLEWTTAARAVRVFGSQVTPTATLTTMLPNLVVVTLALLTVILIEPAALLVAAPLLVAWLLAAPIAYRISQPIVRTAPPLTDDQRRELRGLAWRTWLFYAQFVGPDDNWLPPDHFQESPIGAAAHRTSPTNIGLYLLSALAACDLGYLNAAELALRVDFAFAALDRLERYRGHFLNWIDTGSLQPLLPRYVSTVDSGNLAACLLALKHGCLDLPGQPVWQQARWAGLADIILIAIDALRPFDHAGEDAQGLQFYLDDLRQRIAATPSTPEAWSALVADLNGEGRWGLERLIAAAADSSAASETSAGTTKTNVSFDGAEAYRTARIYVGRMFRHLEALQRELDATLPWLTWMPSAPDLLAGPQAAPELAALWNEMVQNLPGDATWGQVPELCSAADAQLARLAGALSALETHNGHGRLDVAQQYCADFRAALAEARTATDKLLADIGRLAVQAGAYAEAMDFRFLYNEDRQVFHIGYNVDSGVLDNSYYDLLASEARIASLLAIAKGDVLQRHWLHLARPVTRTDDGAQVLLSWSGTMFEYLMPPLLLRTYPDTLLDQTVQAAIDQQISYGHQKNVPWGISESGFYAFDAARGYQYRAFGAPGLGFKRGLADDLVIAPYASLLALPFRPQEVAQNFATMQEMGLLGRYGLYEAADFTTARLSVGQDYAIVRSYMAHHQGMILLALAAWLQGPQMVERFHAEPMVRSVDLLLQEQAPKGALLQFPHEDETAARSVLDADTIQPWRVPVDSPMPLVHYLANGHFGTLLTNAGGGFSQFGDLLLTRWRADTTCDDWGSWVYVRDLASGSTWSAGQQPTGVRGEHAEVTFFPHAAEYRRRDDNILLHMQVTVAPDENVEIRRITLTNDGDTPRRLGVASYAEAVLAPAGADRHQAFTKLFVESEHLANLPALLLRRRPRAATESPAYLLHMFVAAPTATEAWGRASFEGDRRAFLGRYRTARRPTRLEDPAWWAGEAPGTAGPTLDPVVSLGQEVTLAPHATVQLAFVTLATAGRHEALEQAQRYTRWNTIERTFTRAYAAADRDLRQFGPRGPAFGRALQLLSLLVYPHAALRTDSDTLAANTLGQSGLWAYGISGDFPILLVRVGDEAHGDLLQEALQAHRYWRRRGLLIDLVVLNVQETNYGQDLQNYIYRLVRRLDSDAVINQRGGIFLLIADQVGEPGRVLVKTAARVVLDGERGTLAEQLDGIYHVPAPLPAFTPPPPPRTAGAEDPEPILPRPADLQFDNGLGGFSPDRSDTGGRDYVIYLRPGDATPAPWSNVVANPEFGFLATEAGPGSTWAANSGENRLTPWANDPVTDPPAEAIYLRDEETAEVWSPTPQPTPAPAPYIIRHGPGHTTYTHRSHELDQHLRLFAAPDAPVKLLHLRLENRSARPRRLTVTYYVEWVLGVDRASTTQYLVPEFDGERRAILVRNAYSPEFGSRVAFAAAGRDLHGMTADRSEFLGRLGSLQHPDALGRVGLAGRVQPGLDPCAALQLHVDLPAGASHELYFVLGQGDDRQHAHALLDRFRDEQAMADAWQAVHDQWDAILGAIQVETPDPAMDLLLNGRLLYQALACRIWGRSALYQSSGAFGFRDQLQDVMALIYARPQIAREQILRAAAHQFDAGDVLHWWHPPSGRGVRTRISDDLLWLPYVTAHYVTITGDRSILAEPVSFLAGDPLRPQEEERYGLYHTADADATLLEHCRRAIAKGITAGAHGIPLIGGGDWNDGMNRVGVEGKGESIWLGWFACAALEAFATLLDGEEEPGAQAEAADCRARAEAVRQAVEAQGWDGEWYRRAYFDDGSPLGSAQNRECKIDSIAQSWAVLSHAGDPARSRQAMGAVLERLVKPDPGLLLLFAPPFDKTPRDPGYIKGYLPGVRENGGQYTHAALWTIWAMAALGDGDAADRLFRLINPIYHADTPEKAAGYVVEPYVIAADVYGAPPHLGRGGWTWYTGSASWMYRLGIEAMLGLRRAGNRLRIEPAIPAHWPGFCVRLRHGGSVYVVQVRRAPTRSISVDGVVCASGTIELVDDGKVHEVVVEW